MADAAATVIVSIGGVDHVAGTLYSHRRRGKESASFVYAESYLAQPEAYPLDPTLPLALYTQQTPAGLPMFRAFSDTAPDRWGRTLIKRAERRRAEATHSAARSFGEIDFLLGVRDDLRQGALRFQDPETGSYLATEADGVPQLIDLPTLLDLAAHVERDTATDAELATLLRAGSSLGGARPKAHVLGASGKVAIAKFPSANHDTWNVMAWEKVVLDLARAAGIRVSDSQLLVIDGRNVLVVDRFDRVDGERIGYVSAMTMLESTDNDTRSYLEIAEVIEERSLNATIDVHELWRRIAFSILISNTDDHLRNHGFLHSRGDAWTLSPAFDLNPNPDPGPKNLSTAITESDTAATIENLMTVAPFFRLAEEEAVAALAEVAAATRQWQYVADKAGLSATEIAAMSPAFDHSEADAAATVCSARVSSKGH